MEVQSTNFTRLQINSSVCLKLKAPNAENLFLIQRPFTKIMRQKTENKVDNSQSKTAFGNNIWIGFQGNLSDFPADRSYGLDLESEGQGHQWKMVPGTLG